MRDAFHGFEPIIRITELSNDQSLVLVARWVWKLEPMLVPCEIGNDSQTMAKAIVQVAEAPNKKNVVRFRTKHNWQKAEDVSHLKVHRVPLFLSPRILIWRIGRTAPGGFIGFSVAMSRGLCEQITPNIAAAATANAARLTLNEAATHCGCC